MSWLDRVRSIGLIGKAAPRGDPEPGAGSDLPKELPDEWLRDRGVPAELQERLQPDNSQRIAPCGMRRSWVPTRPGLPLIDLFCYRPGCLVNGGHCTGVRLVPDPSLPTTTAEAVQARAGTFVPMPVLREITLHVRSEVAKELRRPSDPGVNGRVIAHDIDLVRAAHQREMRRGGTYG